MTNTRTLGKFSLFKLVMVLLVGGVCIGGAVAITVFGRSGSPIVDIEQVSIEGGHARRPLRQDEAERVGRALSKWLLEDEQTTESLLSVLPSGPGAAYLGVRQDGTLLHSVWRSGGSAAEALIKAAQAIRIALGRRVADATTLQVDLAYDFQRQDPYIDPLGVTKGGLIGIELIHDNRIVRYAPTEMIAANLTYVDVLKKFAVSQGIEPDAIDFSAIRIRTFGADQLLVDLTVHPAKTTLLYRGNIPVALHAITKERIQDLETALSGWLFRNLQPDGRMIYAYLPSAGREKLNANNMIRQWMASIALIRIAKTRNDSRLTERSARNIDYNLRHFYEEEGELGLIDERGRVKLGAVALAALALVEHPQRPKWTAYETKLRNTVNALWNDDGSFDPFFRPRSRTSGQNFYPGEALLLWATLYEESRDPKLLERIMTSMRHYRAWHRANRNPAFIPWHTQAYFKVWEITKDLELAAWIFEMNDWLLRVQQWDEVKQFPDLMGRFYDEHLPFGPPHASATGVYLEGLIDAWRLATMVGHKRREQRYRQAIVRGLRSTVQLTYLNNIDAFYVSDRDVLGGVRTTVYDNVIRVDNVQHNLLAVQKILKHMPAEAFRP